MKSLCYSAIPKIVTPTRIDAIATASFRGFGMLY
eukprot:XP_001708854.1 Hypothetical protein GL50803_9113 [Giardia lamblia ATCC 50803]